MLSGFGGLIEDIFFVWCLMDEREDDEKMIPLLLLVLQFILNIKLSLLRCEVKITI